MRFGPTPPAAGATTVTHAATANARTPQILRTPLTLPLSRPPAVSPPGCRGNLERLLQITRVCFAHPGGPPVTVTDSRSRGTYAPYLPALARAWPGGAPYREIDATLVSVDLSGFTALSERLAQKGKAGAEELILVVSGCFEGLDRYRGTARRRRPEVPRRRAAPAVRRRMITQSAPAAPPRRCSGSSRRRGTDREHGRPSLAADVDRSALGACARLRSRHIAPRADRHRPCRDRDDPARVGRSRPARCSSQRRPRPRSTICGSARRAEARASCSSTQSTGRRPRHRRSDAGADSVEFLPVPLRAALAAGVEPEHRHVVAAFVKFTGVEAVLEERRRRRAARTTCAARRGDGLGGGRARADVARVRHRRRRRQALPHRRRTVVDRRRRRRDAARAASASSRPTSASISAPA